MVSPDRRYFVRLRAYARRLVAARRDGEADVHEPLRLGERQHFYIQDYYLKDVAENTMLHITVEDAQAWYRHAASVLGDGDFPDVPDGDILFASDEILDMVTTQRRLPDDSSRDIEVSVRRVYNQVNELMKKLTD